MAVSMDKNFSTGSFYRDPFFSKLGTINGTTARLLWRESAGMMVGGQLQKRPGRWVKWGVRKTEVPDRPAPHTEIIVDGVTWRIDGEPLDNGNDWTGEALTDQRRGR